MERASRTPHSRIPSAVPRPRRDLPVTGSFYARESEQVTRATARPSRHEYVSEVGPPRRARELIGGAQVVRARSVVEKVDAYLVVTSRRNRLRIAVVNTDEIVFNAASTGVTRS